MLGLLPCGCSGPLAPASEVQVTSPTDRTSDASTAAPRFECVLSSPQDEWKLGETIELRGRMINP